MKTSRLALSTLLLGLAACGGEEGDGAGAGYVDEAIDESALSRTCSRGPTLRGIDVSYWQSTIDWDRVAGAGIEFAFLRVSDGLTHVDSQFARNWAEARRVGIRRGVYQYFRPNLDPIAQANLLLERMGPLEPGDLPPVIDVEASGGLSASAVAARVRTWIDHIEARLGVTPIIYTGPYFWRDQVGGPTFGREHPLWVAHYTTGCPLTPEPWARWSFHQYTDSGRVAGIGGNVDMNYFDGTEAELDALTFQGMSPPPPPPPPTPTPSDCSTLAASGGTIEEDDACVELGGRSQYLRAESSGSDGGHVWTGATDASSVENFARWTLGFSQAGRYRVMAYVQGTSRSTREAKYRVRHAGGQDDVFADQSTARGFFELGTFDFTADEYEVFLADNTGEGDSLDRRVVFDAVRVLAPTSEPCTTVTLARGYSTLNVRPRPNTNRTALTQLTSGQRVTRLATVPGATVNGTTAWQRVRVGSTIGYVSGYYTSCVN
jgi:GH25 family lysozyme M1 (1,4-beta-N-acetylmuramidase)